MAKNILILIDIREENTDDEWMNLFLDAADRANEEQKAESEPEPKRTPEEQHFIDALEKLRGVPVSDQEKGFAIA